MLRSLIAIDLFPSDLSGPEVGAIFRDLALATHTQEVLMRSIWPFRVITIEDAVLTRRGEADSIYMRQFFYRCADGSFYDASPFLFRNFKELEGRCQLFGPDHA